MNGQHSVSSRYKIRKLSNAILLQGNSDTDCLFLAHEQYPAGAYFVAIKELDTHGLFVHLRCIYNVKTNTEPWRTGSR